MILCGKCEPVLIWPETVTNNDLTKNEVIRLLEEASRAEVQRETGLPFALRDGAGLWEHLLEM